MVHLVAPSGAGRIHFNGKIPVFFAPTSPQDLAQDGTPDWCSDVFWLLLDCVDATRRHRLTQRPGWTEAMIVEALADAQELRRSVSRRIDTDALPPATVAQRVRGWVQQALEHGQR